MPSTVIPTEATILMADTDPTCPAPTLLVLPEFPSKASLVPMLQISPAFQALPSPDLNFQVLTSPALNFQVLITPDIPMASPLKQFPVVEFHH